jgi:hypothetical protein
VARNKVASDRTTAARAAVRFFRMDLSPGEAMTGVTLHILSSSVWRFRTRAIGLKARQDRAAQCVFCLIVTAQNAGQCCGAYRY